MRKKIVQLVEFNHPIPSWALYEAIIDTDTNNVEWIADTPIKDGIFYKYQEAVEEWGKREKKYSGLLDIFSQEQYIDLQKEYEEKEVNF